MSFVYWPFESPRGPPYPVKRGLGCGEGMIGSRKGFWVSVLIDLMLGCGELAGVFLGTASYPVAPPDMVGTAPPASASSLPLPGTCGSYRYATSGYILPVLCRFFALV